VGNNVFKEWFFPFPMPDLKQQLWALPYGGQLSLNRATVHSTVHAGRLQLASHLYEGAVTITRYTTSLEIVSRDGRFSCSANLKTIEHVAATAPPVYRFTDSIDEKLFNEVVLANNG
jgi:hypothetical protein